MLVPFLYPTSNIYYLPDLAANHFIYPMLFFKLYDVFKCSSAIFIVDLSTSESDSIYSSTSGSGWSLGESFIPFSLFDGGLFDFIL